MSRRIREHFAAVRAHAARSVPWLGRVRIRRCPVADRDHARVWRLFMHSNHHPLTVCHAAAASAELTDLEIQGMIGHELGHVVGEEAGFPEHARPQRGAGTPPRVQAEADWIARKILGIPIGYNARTLEELRLPRRRLRRR